MQGLKKKKITPTKAEPTNQPIKIFPVFLPKHDHLIHFFANHAAYRSQHKQTYNPISQPKTIPQTTMSKTTTTTTATLSTAASTPDSPSPPAQLQWEEPDICFICQKQLALSNDIVKGSTRHTCCGKRLHIECHNKRINSQTADHLKQQCHHCSKPIPKTEKVQIERLREWVDKGKAWAQMLMAQMYREGECGVEQSYSKALVLYEKAADQGDPDAAYGLACLYENGDGVVVQSYTKAAALFTSLVDLGHVHAMVNLALLYRDGQGVAQSSTKAVEFLTMAADEGHVGAMYSLGNLYREGQGVAQSTELAHEWFEKFEKAAEQGDHNSTIYNLGHLYRDGTGVTQSFTKAFELYTTAAQKGNIRAMYDLGNCFRDGRGVTQSFKTAIELYTKAAEKGEVDSMVSLGALYLRGQGVAQSYKLTREWWTKAASQGHVDAIYNLKYVFKLDCCAACNTPQSNDHTLNRCKCHHVYYCNSACQRAHWVTHRDEHRRLMKEKKSG